MWIVESLTRETNWENDLGCLNGVYPRVAFHRTVKTAYWIPSPSLFSNGHMLRRGKKRRVSTTRQIPTKSYLKTATLLVNIPSSHVVLSTLPEAPVMIKVSGSNGTRMVFSWTWKEKRKKESEDVSIEKSKREKRGPGSVADNSFSCWPFCSSTFAGGVTRGPSTKTPEIVEGSVGSSFIRKLNPVLNNPTTAGENPTAVNSVESFTNAPEPAKLRHLRTTFEKHQKFATLSSKSPREKGNILVMGSRIAVGDANGGRKGKNRRRKDATVTMLRCTNSFPLHDVEGR